MAVGGEVLQTFRSAFDLSGGVCDQFATKERTRHSANWRSSKRRFPQFDRLIESSTNHLHK